MDGYGPVLGYQSPTLTANTLLADTLVWRSRGIDPSCFYNLGARYCDPVSGHFLSPDPLGHAGSMDLHSFCNGDPVNCFDPTGRFAKGDSEQANNDLESAGQDLHTAFNNARENAMEFDVAHEDQIDDTLTVVADAAVAFGLPVVAEGLLGEGLVAEAGVGLEEGELGGIEGFNARSAVSASSLGESEGVGLAEAETVETGNATGAASAAGEVAPVAGQLPEAQAVWADVAASAGAETGQAVAATTSETASTASQAPQFMSEFSGAGNGAAAEGTGATTWQGYERAVQNMYGGPASFSSRQYQAVVNGNLVNGVADNVTTIGGNSVAVEAKFVNNWSTSLRNPPSQVGNMPFAVKAQAEVLSQAQKYSSAFGQVIYHSNSSEFID